MNRFVILFSILAGSVLMTQCTAKKATTSAMTPEQAIAEIKKNYTAEQLEEGKTIFLSNCDKCHALNQPETRDIAKWEKVLPRMSKKANLDNEKAGKVRAYVLAHAKL